MRRQIITLFTVLWTVLLVPAVQAQERGALFKAEQGGHTLYLFGTMHVGVQRFFPLEPRIEQAVASASVLAVEADVSANPAEVARLTQQYALRTPGIDPYAQMPAATRASLLRVLQRSGVSEQALAMFRPWMLASLLSLTEFTAKGYSPELAVDSYLVQLAKRNKVKVVELESVEAQLSLFAGLGAEGERAFLEDTVNAIDSGKEEHDAHALAQAWEHADRAALDGVVADLEKDTSFSARFVHDKVLVERNLRMADKLAALLKKEKSAVAAIGTLHLLGSQGLPALLRARGIKVERVY